MFTLQKVRDIYYQSASGEEIYMIVKWAEFDEEHPFTASSYDSMEHGRDLYVRARRGDFGPVGAYIPQPETPLPQATQPQPSSQGAQNL
jgi:hypothetical protein